MDLIQDYTSDSDSPKEEPGNTDSLNTTEGRYLSPPAPPPIQIFLQQYQNMHSASKVSAMFISIPWTPLLAALSQLEKAVNHVVSQTPALSQNHKFIVPNKDPFRVEKHHITIFPTLHVKEELEQQFIRRMSERVGRIKPPGDLINSRSDHHSPLSKILNNSKPSISLHLEEHMAIAKSPLKDSLFCILRIRQTPDTLRYFSDLVECCKKTAKEFDGQLQFPHLLNDPMHVSIATGYVTKSILSIEEIDKLNQQVGTIDVSQFTKDIQVVVDELTIRNMYEMTSTSLALV